MDLPNYEDQEDVGKDFQSLADIPLTSDHFIPKSEKHWSINVSHFSEFFSLDPKVLSAAIGCIPFDEYTGVNSELFTPDQLTQIHNAVDESKIIYQNILLDLDKLCEETNELSMDSNTSMKPQDTFEEGERISKVEESNSDIKDEDLDFLLTLKEPIRSDQVSIPPLSTSHTDNVKSQEVPSKSVDLEKWLDSILDD